MGCAPSWKGVYPVSYLHKGSNCGGNDFECFLDMMCPVLKFMRSTQNHIAWRILCHTGMIPFAGFFITRRSGTVMIIFF